MRETAGEQFAFLDTHPEVAVLGSILTVSPTDLWVILALVSVTAGLVAAFPLRLAAGGAIVLTALLVYALVSPSARARVRLGRRGT